jgi:hypothetical protein
MSQSEAVSVIRCLTNILCGVIKMAEVPRLPDEKEEKKEEKKFMVDTNSNGCITGFAKGLDVVVIAQNVVTYARQKSAYHVTHRVEGDYTVAFHCRSLVMGAICAISNVKGLITTSSDNRFNSLSLHMKCDDAPDCDIRVEFIHTIPNKV